MCKLIAKDLVPKLMEYYKRTGNSLGGDYHIVLEDGNTSDAHITFGLNQAIYKNDELGIEIGETLLEFTISQRKKLHTKYYRNYTFQEPLE